MKFAFTICSINYLAQAKTLAQTLKDTNPDYRFVVGLCDRLDKSELDQTQLAELEILEVHQIGIERFEAMCDRYDITELNTAVKPFYFDYFFNKVNGIESVIYFDPDIEVFEKLKGIEEGLEQHNIVLTPHLFTPIFDDLKPREQEIFVNGIYNLGFCAVKKSTESQRFIDWWKIKLETECYMDVQRGMFVDQMYCNVVPLYFEGVKVDKYPGYNISYWNLHERHFTEKENKKYINDLPLVFYHYSGIDITDYNSISRWTQRHDLNNRPELRPLYTAYRDKLMANGHAYFKTIPCFYLKPKPEPPRKSILKRIFTSITFRIYYFFEKLPI
jgi:hypothetical protein